MMVQGLDATENPDAAPLTLEGVEGGSRPAVRRKGNARYSFPDKFKYRHNLNIARLKKQPKHPKQHGHFNTLTRDQGQPAHAQTAPLGWHGASNSRRNPDMEVGDAGVCEDKGSDGGRFEAKDLRRGIFDSMSGETDVPADQNDIEMSYNLKQNAVQYVDYFSSTRSVPSQSVLNTSGNVAAGAPANPVSGVNINEISDLIEIKPFGNNLSEVSNRSAGASGVSTPAVGARLVRKEITKLGALDLLPKIEDYVQVNFANYRQFYEKVGPIRLSSPLSDGLRSNHVEISLWNDAATQLISQNSSKRKVYNIFWLPRIFSNISLRAAIKFVEDCNVRDGRSIKREIECHLYMYQRFQALSKTTSSPSLILQDEWPTVEVLGYYLDKKDPGQSILVSRKLTGPDFFYIIRSENSSNFVKKITPIYEFNKLDWCITALNRIAQFGSVGIRHNDIKPDNIVLDVYFDQGVKKVDVKIIDLGAASMEFTKEFTGGTPWYESPEQKLLEYYTKKNRNSEMAQRVAIDVSSDAWGAGLSIVEVLMGKRVVDYIKQPYGIGLLNFTGIPACGCNNAECERCSRTDAEFVSQQDDVLWWNRPEYWEVSPELWVEEARKVLGLTCENCSLMQLSDAPCDDTNLPEVSFTDNVTFDQNCSRHCAEFNLAGGGAEPEVFRWEEFEDFYRCGFCRCTFNENVRENICRIVSRYVFNSLVVVDPRNRRTVQEVADRLRSFVTRAVSYYL